MTIYDINKFSTVSQRGVVKINKAGSRLSMTALPKGKSKSSNVQVPEKKEPRGIMETGP